MPRRALLTTSAFAVTLAALLGAAAPAQACPRDPAEQQAVAAVASAALDRLEIADDVAASKYLSGKAVADPAREQAVVDATIAAAKADGVDPVAAAHHPRADHGEQAGAVRAHRLLAREPRAGADDRARPHHERPPAHQRGGARLVPAIGAASAALADPAGGQLVKDARGHLGQGLDDAHRKAFRTALATVCTPES